MTHMRTRIFSILLTCAMLLSLLPATALAEEGTECTNPDCSHVAAIGNTHYDTLADAVDAVVSSNDKAGTVTLLKDAQGCGIGLFNNKGHVGIDLTIDFGGHTYTAGDLAVGSVGTESQAFHLEKDNTVTLKNGTITVASDSQNTAMLIQNYSDLTLDNIDLIGNSRTKYIISCNYGDTVLKDVNISGKHRELVALDLMHWLGTSYADQAPTMSIQNTAENTISGSVDVYCYGTGANSCPSKPSKTITGGTFSSDVSAYVDLSSNVTKGADGNFVIIPNEKKDGVAEIDGKYYKTLGDAIASVGDGETIQVLKDIPNAKGISVPSGKNFTIDFGGYTYTLTGPGAGSPNTETNGFQLLKDSTITMKNGASVPVTGITIRIAENANKIKRIIQNYADLTLENMQFYAKNQVDGEDYALSFNNGNVTFKGTTSVITSSSSNVAFDVCKFSDYPGATVTFDESYTGTVNGQIVYNSTDATN